jgi:hypothetical protein
MEPSGRNRWQTVASANGAEIGGIKRKRLPCVATSCRRSSMVRRGCLQIGLSPGTTEHLLETEGLDGTGLV